MTTKIIPKGVLIPRENEGMYIKLIEKYGLNFALILTKIVNYDPDFSLEEKFEASKMYLGDVADILVRNFVHCKGYTLEISSGYEREMGFFIEARCPNCYGFDSHFSVSPGKKNGVPIYRVTNNWDNGVKRKH